MFRLCRHNSAGRACCLAVKLSAAMLMLVCWFGTRIAYAGTKAADRPTLQVTPSSVTLLVNEASTCTAVDQDGRALKAVEWSIRPQIAELKEVDGEVTIIGKQAGRAVLTARGNDQFATAAVTIAAGEKLPVGTVRWTVEPLPGYETLMVVQAVPSQAAPTFYSVEWSKSEKAVVRALTESGQQLWRTQLLSSASPMTLKNTVPAPGQVLQNDALISDHSMFIIGEKSGFALNNATDPSSYGLPADGKSIFLGASGDDAGGMVFLERGRFRDALVDLSAAGDEVWRYRSEGRLTNHWTVNWSGDIGIVETLAKPPSSALLVLNAGTGIVRFKIPFPVSSSTIDGYRCADPQRNILKSVRPSVSGSVFTSTDGNMYLQVGTHVESLLIENCKNKNYTFDETLALLRVTPEGENEWKTFQHIHADGEGGMIAQPRIFAGESIPDGFGGVLAAWTYLSPDNSGGQIRSEARLSRISELGQRDFTLPMPYWTKGLNSFFDSNMVLGEGNFLYAVNGPQLLRMDTEKGEVNWVRHPPKGEVKLDHSTAGGGVLVSNAGLLVYFDADGNGGAMPCTLAGSNPEDIGLVQTDLLDGKPMEALQLREADFTWAGGYIAVEDGAPYGRGRLVHFLVK